MLFLMNDVILNIDLQQLTQPAVAQSVGSMTLAQVTALGQEMFAEAPRLQHHTGAASAIRLATLITARIPTSTRPCSRPPASAARRGR